MYTDVPPSGQAGAAQLAPPITRIVLVPRTRLRREGGAYTFGLAKNHGYADGNKRVALAAGATLLHVNGVDFIVDEEQVVVVIHALCEDEIDEASLASWFRENSAPR